MPKYENGKIYKLVCNITGLIYIGSTTRTLIQRKGNHVSNWRQWKIDSTIGKCTSTIILDKEDFKIELIEDYPCNTKQELNVREQFHIENNDCVNKQNAFGNKWDKPHHCDICNVDLATYEYYVLSHIKSEVHINNELGISQYYHCDDCNQDVMKSLRNRHEISEKHKGTYKRPPVELWYCDVCEDEYSLSHKDYHLTSIKHLQKLNEINPNQCPECDKILSNTSKMRRHLRDVHKIEPEKKETDFYCEVCECYFQSNQHLKNHYKTQKHINR